MQLKIEDTMGYYKTRYTYLSSGRSTEDPFDIETTKRRMKSLLVGRFKRCFDIGEASTSISCKVSKSALA